MKILKKPVTFFKFLTALLVMILLSNIISIDMSVQSSNPTQLRIDPLKVEYWTPALNKIFVINITIINVTDLQCYGFELYWDTTLLDLVNIKEYDFLNEPFTVITNGTDEDLGMYWHGELSSGPPKTGSGSLVSLSFKITYDPTYPENASCALNLANTKLLSSSGTSISHDVYDGQYWCYATPPAGVTVATDMQSYYLSTPIVIYGNLTYGFSPTTDGLLSLHVVNPLNQPLVTRTLSIGSPPTNLLVNIQSIFPCDSQGKPKSSFNAGSQAYFNVSVVNNDVTTRDVCLAVNLFGANNKPVGYAAKKTSIAPGGSWTSRVLVEITGSAPTGIAFAYASALTNWPNLNGAAYCPEKSAQFEIKNGGSEQSGSPGPQMPGNYNFTLYLPFTERKGTYKIYINSLYEGQLATDNTSFQATVPDLNNDNTVDIFDITIIAVAFESKPGDSNWNPVADVKEDEIIDIFDIAMVAIYFGWY